MAVIILFASCNKHDFDLDKLNFPIEKSSLVEKFKLKENKDFVDFTFYETSDKAALYFDDFHFSGSLDSNNESLLTNNRATFIEDNKTKRIDAFEININTTDKTEEFEKLVETKFGKTDFYYRNDDFSYRIWEKSGKMYFFETNNTGIYNDRKFKSCQLNVVNSQNKFLVNYFIAGGFQYFGDYLYEKEKPENKNKKFTYRDFVEKQEKEDGKDSYFVKDYVK